MIFKILMVFLVLLALLAGWIAVQAAARRFARRHPETGPYREAGCSHGCGSCAERCDNAEPTH